MIWLTSDEHYFHSNIIKYAKRPFSSITDMHEELISRHNQLVARDDTCYHLGDFSFGDYNSILRRLKGRHILILGNHDRRNVARNADFISTHDVLHLNLYGESVFLSHYGHRVWNKAHHGAYHFFGHSHGSLPPHYRSMDVGVDVERRYAPWNILELFEKLKDQPFGHHHGD